MTENPRFAKAVNLTLSFERFHKTVAATGVALTTPSLMGSMAGSRTVKSELTTSTRKKVFLNFYK